VNSHYNSDIDLQEVDDLPENDREISLGAATILGIFFALALICAIFFGFGYTMGRRSALPATTVAETVTTSGVGTSKPAPGSQPTQPASTSSPNRLSADVAATSPIDSADTPTSSPAAPTVALSESAAKPGHPTPAPQLPATGPSAMLAAQSVVQVAAVSHQEDADILLTALKRRGYNVAIRQEPQDKLLHVQIGPFATKKDAEAMRQKLLTDGYNAIVK